MLQDSSHAKVKIKLLYICDCINILLSDLSPWLVSIETQLWWCFGSSIGNLTMLREKLDSITEHICNIHSFTDNEQYRECGHPPITEQQKRSKSWLVPNTLVSTKTDMRRS